MKCNILQRGKRMNQEVSITKEQVQKEMKYFRRLFRL